MATQSPYTLRDMRENSDKVFVQSRLLRQWAPPFEGRSASGVEAALAIIRRILFFSSDLDRPEEHDIGDNPLVRYAWLEFPDTPAGIASVKAEQDKLWQAIGQLCPDLSFAGIMESDMMGGTFWARSSHRLVQVAVRYVSAKLPESDELVGIREDITKSLVVWDGALELGSFISSKFGRFKDGNQTIIARPSRPRFLRVIFTPGDDTPTRTWSDLLTIRVGPGPPVVEIPPEDRFQVWRSPGDQYRLFGVVRLRAHQDEEDRVRVYDIKGQSVDNLAGARSCISDDWKVGERGHSYFLYYTVTSHESISWAEEVTYEDVERRKTDDLVAAMIAAGKQQLYGPPPNAPKGPRLDRTKLPGHESHDNNSGSRGSESNPTVRGGGAGSREYNSSNHGHGERDMAGNSVGVSSASHSHDGGRRGGRGGGPAGRGDRGGGRGGRGGRGGGRGDLGGDRGGYGRGYFAYRDR